MRIHRLTVSGGAEAVRLEPGAPEKQLTKLG